MPERDCCNRGVSAVTASEAEFGTSSGGTAGGDVGATDGGSVVTSRRKGTYPVAVGFARGTSEEAETGGAINLPAIARDRCDGPELPAETDAGPRADSADVAVGATAEPRDCEVGTKEAARAVTRVGGPTGIERITAGVDPWSLEATSTVAAGNGTMAAFVGRCSVDLADVGATTTALDGVSNMGKSESATKR